MALTSFDLPAESVLEDELKDVPTDRTRAVGYRILVWTLRIAILGGFLAGWQILGSSTPYWTLVLTSPSKIWSVLQSWSTGSLFWTDLRVTLIEAALGFLLGTVLAVIVVAIVVATPLLDRFLRPFLAVLNALPKVVLAPLFLVWFGINTRAKVYFVASVIFFVVFYGVEKGLKSIDRQFLDNTKALGATKRQLVRNVYLPAIATWICSSLRLSVAFALLAAVFSEFLGASEGVGRRISNGQQLLHNDEVMAGIFVIAVVALIADRLLLRVERRFTRWRLF